MGWTTLAMQLDTSIGKLTRDFKKYKERVAKQMRDEDTA